MQRHYKALGWSLALLLLVCLPMVADNQTNIAALYCVPPNHATTKNEVLRPDRLAEARTPNNWLGRVVWVAEHVYGLERQPDVVPCDAATVGGFVHTYVDRDYKHSLFIILLGAHLIAASIAATAIRAYLIWRGVIKGNIIR